MQNTPYYPIQPASEYAYQCIQKNFESVPMKFQAIRQRHRSLYQDTPCDIMQMQSKALARKNILNRLQVNTKLCTSEIADKGKNLKQVKFMPKNLPKISDDLHLPSVFKNREAVYSNDR